VQMLQVMENAWLSLNLDVNYAHPLNRGWMDVFHRWTGSAEVRQVWPLLRSEFARGFVNFCEKQMRMGVIEGKVERLSSVDQMPDRLVSEFKAQWPREKEGLKERVAAALKEKGGGAWLISPESAAYPSVRDEPNGKTGSLRIEAGVIAVTPLAPVEKEPTFELFVWVRGAYRNAGLGRRALRMVLAELEEKIKEPFRLRVRLPVADLNGPGGELQKRMWRTFFHNLDFVRPEAVRDKAAVTVEQGETEEVLERRFKAAETVKKGETEEVVEQGFK